MSGIKRAAQSGNFSALCLFSLIDLEEMLAKGNIWYVRHYEALFDRVYVCYLYSSRTRAITRGNTTLIAFGSGGPKFLNMLLAPVRLLRVASFLNLSTFLSADLLFSWWSFLLLRLLKKRRFVLMPVCMPHELFRNGGATLIGLPRCVERILVRTSFFAASGVATIRTAGAYVDWLTSYSASREKLRIFPVLPETLPSMGFLAKARNLSRKDDDGSPAGTFRILYVGGLRKEKLVDHLVRMLKCLVEGSKGFISYRLRIVGDGPCREELETLALSLGVQHCVEFSGAVSNESLVEEYAAADVFVSPLTGTSLREAALCAMPLVAYGIDWVPGVFTDGEDILLAEGGDYEGLAKRVELLYDDAALRRKLSGNVRELAWRLFAMPMDARETIGKELERMCSLEIRVPGA